MARHPCAVPGQYSCGVDLYEPAAWRVASGRRTKQQVRDHTKTATGLFSAGFWSLLSAQRAGEGRFGRIALLGNGEYGPVSTHAFWFRVEEIEFARIMLALDVQRTIDTVALLGYRHHSAMRPKSAS